MCVCVCVLCPVNQDGHIKATSCGEKCGENKRMRFELSSRLHHFGSSPEDGVWLPMCRVIKQSTKHRHTKSSRPMERICQCTMAYTGSPPECSPGEHYNENFDPYPVTVVLSPTGV